MASSLYMSSFGILLITVALCQYSPSCQDSPFNTYPYCNPSLSISERINDLYPRLTLAEKNNLTNSNQGGVLRLAIPPLQVNQGCIHGATWKDQPSRNTHPTTQFPQAVTLAQSFNRQFFQYLGRATSDEVRAGYNEAANNPLYDDGHGQGLVCWGPNVNICRDPRWGRCQESYGEDPFLTAEYVKHVVHEMQFNINATDYYQIAATCKHLDVHSGPDNIPQNRASFDAIVAYNDWYLTFQPAFKSCADAGVASFMCSYNEINGIPACGNEELLQNIAREEWKWDGFICSDCGATPQIYSWQNFTRNFIEAAQVAVKAGTDWNGNCGKPDQQLQDLKYGVLNGTLPEFYLERAVKRVLKAWFKLGLMDAPINVFEKLTVNETYNKHIGSNYEMAVGSIVLLENRKNILPLTLNANITIGLVGPCIDNIQCYIGDYSEHNPPYYNGWITPLQQIKKLTTNILYATGCNLTSCNDMTVNSMKNVLQVVDESDILFYFGGISVEQESEMNDRTHLQLPYNQSLLFQNIYNSLNGKKIISVISYGAPFIDDLMFSSSNALIGAGYTGMQIGAAIWDIIFGGKSPMAKTVITWYHSINELPAFTDYNMIQKPFGRTYRYFNATPYYPFGYGLSYTEFKYTALALNGIPLLSDKLISITPCMSVSVQVNIENIGNQYTSDEITQIYMTYPLDGHSIASHTENIKLVNFTRSLNIKPNMNVNVSLLIVAQSMVIVTDYEFIPVIQPGIYTIYVGDTLDAKNMLNQQFQIVGDQTPISQCHDTNNLPK